MRPAAQRAAAFLERRRTWLAAALIVLGLLLAWRARFLMDDAFISFTYARNLVEGQGLTWFGQRVEGYTNFLWVLWLALAMRLGGDPAAAATVGGLASFLVVLVVSWRTSALVLRPAAARLFALVVLVTNFTFLSFATGGLETMFLAAWIALALYSVQALVAGRGPVPPRRLAALSLVFAALLLTRLDAAVVVVALTAVAFAAVGRRGGWSAGRLAALALPAALVVVGWWGWKLAFYGDVLPNTYYAKLAGGEGLAAAGLVYLGRFLHAYLLWPLLALGVLLSFAGGRPRQAARLLPSAAVVAASWAYAVYCGGDFMEFRFLVPSFPALALLLAALLAGRPLPDRRRRGLLAAALALLIAASAVHARRFVETTPDHALDSVHRLRTFYGVYPDEDWRRLGDALARQLGDLDPTVALTAVGAIPFYGRLATVDMHGLNDREIARRGLLVAADFRRPGHQRYATLRQLRARGVHLVFGHPTELPLTALAAAAEAELVAWVRRTLPFEPLAGETPTLVAVPVSETEGLLAWFLTPAEPIDRRIRTRGWPTRRLRMP